MTVPDQAAGVLVFAATYLVGVALAAYGQRYWVRHLPTALQERLGPPPDTAIAQLARTAFRHFRSTPVLSWFVGIVLTAELLFAVRVSLGVELLYVAALAVTFAGFDIRRRVNDCARAVDGRLESNCRLPQAWRAGLLLAHLGYWGAACSLGGLVAVLID
jgi:hypothetical protein